MAKKFMSFPKTHFAILGIILWRFLSCIMARRKISLDANIAEEVTGNNGVNSNQKDGPFFDIKFSHIFQLLPALLLVIIGGLQSCIMSRQSSIMNDQNNFQRQQMMAVVVPDLIVEPSENGDVTATPEFENTGSTQTKQMWANVTGGFFKSEGSDANGDAVYPSAVRPTIKDFHNRFWLGPHQKFRVDGLAKLFTNGDISTAASRGVYGPTFFGIVQYNDVFHNTPVHTQRFCYIIWQSESLIGKDKWKFSQCGGNQNCTDDECTPDSSAPTVSHQ